MNEDQIREVVQRLVSEGKDKAVILEVVRRLREQQPQEQPQAQQEAPTPTEPPQDAAVPPQEIEQPYQPDWAEIKRKNAEGEPLSKDEHNAQQEVFARAIASATAAGPNPVPEFMVPAISAFGEGVLQLASGTVKGLKSIALYAKEKFDPEFAAEVADNPEVREQYFKSITDIDEKIDEFAGDLSVGKRQYDSSSITELATRGELGQAGALAAQQTVGALPSVLATMTGWGGMATLGVSAAGSSFEEDMERHPEQTIDRLVGAAWAKGGVELASEMVTRGIAKRAGLLIGKGQSVDAAKQFTQGALRRITKDASMEGISEGAADTASKYIDELVHGDEYTAKQYLTDFLDNAIVGAAMGGGVSSIGALNSGNTMERAAAAEALKSDETAEVEAEAAKNINAAEAMKKKVQEENTAEDQTETEQVDERSLILEVLDQQIADEQAKVAEAKKKDLDALNDMTEEEITRVAKAKDRQRKAEKAAKKETDPDKKTILENTAAIAKQQATEVYDNVKNHEAAVEEAEIQKEEIDTKVEEKVKKFDDQLAKMAPKTSELNQNPEQRKKAEALIKEMKAKRTEIEKQKQEVVEEATKQKKAIDKTLEAKRPGYDHNLKSKKKKKKTYEEAQAQYQAEVQPAKRQKYLKEAKQATESYAKTATNKAFEQLTGYGAKMSISGKALTRQDVRKYVDDEVHKAIAEGKKPYVRDLVRRAKRKVLQEYTDKTIRKPGKKATVDEKANYRKAKAIKAQEDALLENIKPQEERLAELERELAKPNLPRKQRRALEGEIDALRDEVSHGRAVAADATQVSLDQAAGEEASLADFIKDDSGQVDKGAVQPTEEVAKRVGLDEGQRSHIQTAVNEAISLGGIDISSPGAITEVGADPMVETEIKNAILPFTKSKKDIMDNAQQVIDLLPEAFKSKRGIEEAADLDDFISGSNQSRALGQVRDAVKAGIVESFVEQAAKDGDGVDMTEYLESTKSDSKAGVIDLVMHLNRVYPGMKFFVSKKAMATKLADGGYFGDVDNINAFLADNEIYMNPDHLTIESPIHEMGHVWAKGLKVSDPALYKRGVELLKDSNIWKDLEVSRKNPDSVYYNYSDAKFEEEVLATAIGRHADVNMASDAQQKGWSKFIEDLSGYIRQVLGLKGDPMKMDVHDYLSYATQQILTGKAKTPAQAQVEYLSTMDLLRGNTEVERMVSRAEGKDQKDMHKIVDGEGRVIPFRGDRKTAMKVQQMLGGKIEFSEVADDALARVKKELARLERLDQSLPGVADNVRRLKTRVNQLQKQSLPQATKLADMMMLNPVLKNKIRAAEPVKRKRGGVPNTDLQARKTVAAVMKVMSALPAAGRIEFANQLQRGIKSNTLAGNQNVAGFQNSIIAKEILTEGGIDFEGIDMNDNLLLGVANAMNNNNVRGVFGEEVNWSKVDYKGGNAEIVKANKGAIKAFFSALGGLNKLGQIDGQTINKIQNIWGAAGQHSLYRGATGEPKFFHKNAKRGKGAQKGYIREHVLPASEFFDKAFSAARKGRLDAELGKLLDNYQLVILSEADDTRVNGEGFKDRQPDVFGELMDQKLGELPASYMRYFNGKVALNPTDYVDANGRTMASYMGISPEAQRRLQSSGIDGIEFSESQAVNEDTAMNAEANNKIRKSKEKAIRKKLKDRYVYKTPGDFKKSKIPAETRDILDATLKHFDQVSDQLNDAQLESLSNRIDEVVKEGKETTKAIRKSAQEAKEARQSEVNKLVEETGGVDPENMTSNQVAALNKARKSWFGRMPKSLGELLSPASNNDFYGLLYNLYPKGANRAKAKKFIDDNLIKPLETAGIEYITLKQNMKDAYNNLKTNSGITEKVLNEKSGIAVKGIESLSNDQAIRVYNYIKDPKLHKQLENTGIDTAKMIEIVNYVNNNAQLKHYADGLPTVYAIAAGKINNRLNEHGRETFSNVKIDQNKLSEEQQEVMSVLYPDGIPEFAPYTPLTAEGTDTDTTFENLTKDGNFNMYSVMDGRLKRRTGGGDINLMRSTIDSDFNNYLSGPVHTYAYLDFARNASNIFGPKQIKAMEAAYGSSWSSAMKDSLRRIITGKAQSAYQPEAIKEFNKWVNRTVGGVMFFNVKSAILQQISMFNFAADDFGAVTRGWKSKNKYKVKEFLKNSAWVKQRGEGKTDVALDELFAQRDQNYIDTMLEKGYSLTKMGDRTAITNGGAPYMAGKYDQYLSDGLSEQEAMDNAYRDFIRLAEETQQSTRQERLGQQQTTGVGKLLLAFANTQQQYNRKMAKAVKDIAAGDNVAQNIKTLAYYGGIQNIMFTSAQNLLFAGVGLSNDDEEANAADWANRLADTILRGIGIWGGIAAAAKNAIIAASAERGADKKVMEAMVNAAPALGTKIRNIQVALNAKPIYAQSEWAEDNEDLALLMYRTGAAANAVSNIPLDRAIKLAEQAADLTASDLDEMERLARLGGWSRYTLGKSAGSSPLNKLNIVEDENEPGVLGRADKDGTVHIRPGLSPAKREEVLKHEGKHAKDMKDGTLDYTDNSITYKGKKYDRKNGKIYHGGRWVKEGDKSLPWEKAADKAMHSPMKATLGEGPGDKKKKKPKKEVTHSMYVPGYTKHFGWAGEREDYHQGLGGSEGGQGGLIYQQTRRTPGKSGGTAYTAGILQNSYGDPIGVAGVGREWKLGEEGKTKVGIHGGATVGYKPSFERNKVNNLKRNMIKQGMDADALEAWINKNPAEFMKMKNNFMEQTKGNDPIVDAAIATNLMPLITASIEREFGDSGISGKAIVNPMYANLGVSADLNKVFKRKKKSPHKATEDDMYRKKAKARRKKLTDKYGDDSYIDPNYRDYKRKSKLWELGVPQDESEVVKKAKDWTRNWENDPETLKKWQEGDVGLTDSQLAKQATRQQLTATRGFKEGERESDQHWGRYKPYQDEMILAEDAPEEIAIHELAHAGFDMERGAWVKDIVGPVKLVDAFGNVAEGETEYINNPQETGAYLQQIRGQLGLKPGEKVTPEMLQSVDDKHNLYLKAVRQNGKEEALLEAMNTVASVEPDEDRAFNTGFNAKLNNLFQQDQSGYA